MTGTSWLIDSKRIASKIKNASGAVDSSRVKWMSNPSKACPRCKHMIDNSDVVHEWPGLPRGVKFDPSDQELLWHLLEKVGKGNGSPHPFVNEFIPTVDKVDGICYTHPQKLPGVKQDGSVSHFFHRTFKAYNTGTRKRRKILNDDLGDVRWHKTGKTKPVIIDGKHTGCKKIMVLYMSPTKGEKPEKTNWVIHQYHLGTGEDEQDGEFVVSKLFYQQQFKLNDKGEQESTMETEEHVIAQVNPVDAPELVTPEHHDYSPKQASDQVKVSDCGDEEHIVHSEFEKQGDQDNHPTEDTKWWDGESQFLLDSQQLAEGIAICEEFLESQPLPLDDESKSAGPRLSDYAHIGVDVLKKDLEECRNMGNPDQTNAELELDTPPDMRLSQLEFGSQDSFAAWGGCKFGD